MTNEDVFLISDDDVFLISDDDVFLISGSMRGRGAGRAGRAVVNHSARLPGVEVGRRSETQLSIIVEYTSARILSSCVFMRC